MVTQFMAVAPLAVLKPPMGSLIAYDTEIGNALDLVLAGI